jgi:hypothetical protein
VHTPLTGATCDDGDPCTVDDVCDAAGGCSGVAPDCDDDDPCTSDGCAPSGDCVHDAADNTGGACDDGDACTVDDVCGEGGACAGSPVACDDANPCTLDACDPGDGGCVFTPDVGAPCDDASLCTTSDACDASGACVGVAIPCNDGDPCTIDTCWPGTGQCVSRPLGVTVTKTASTSNWDVRGEFGRARLVRGPVFSGNSAVVDDAGFLVALRLTVVGSLDLGPGRTMTAFGGGSVLAPPPVSLIFSPLGRDSQLRDLLYTESVAVAVGRLVDEASGAWSAIVLVRVLLGQQVDQSIAGASDLLSVDRTATGFVAVGSWVPAPAAPGGIALVLLDPFGQVMTATSLGEPADTGIHVTATASGAIIVGRRNSGTPLLVQVDTEANAEQVVGLPALGWTSVDAAHVDESHIAVVGLSSDGVRVVIADHEFSVVHEFGVPGPSFVRSAYLAGGRLALAGSQLFDAWVGVCDMSGNVEWDQTFDGGEQYAAANSVVIDPGGKVSVFGLAGASTPSSPLRYPMQAHLTVDGTIDCAP